MGRVRSRHGPVESEFQGDPATITGLRKREGGSERLEGGKEGGREEGRLHARMRGKERKRKRKRERKRMKCVCV